MKICEEAMYDMAMILGGSTYKMYIEMYPEGQHIDEIRSLAINQLRESPINGVATGLSAEEFIDHVIELNIVKNACDDIEQSFSLFTEKISGIRLAHFYDDSAARFGYKSLINSTLSRAAATNTLCKLFIKKLDGGSFADSKHGEKRAWVLGVIKETEESVAKERIARKLQSLLWEEAKQKIKEK